MNSDYQCVPSCHSGSDEYIKLLQCKHNHLEKPELPAETAYRHRLIPTD